MASLWLIKQQIPRLNAPQDELFTLFPESFVMGNSVLGTINAQTIYKIVCVCLPLGIIGSLISGARLCMLLKNLIQGKACW
ncbi:MAG: hypothetical protein WA432_01775 [Candidatus Babeliaceae bacterium]